MDQLSRREREKQQRESEIVSAAERVFYLKGYNDASMDEIAREAEFAKGTIYQYFTGKEDLYFAVTLKGLKLLYEQLTGANKPGLSGLGTVREVGLRYFKFSRANPEMFRLMNYSQYIRGDGTGRNFSENAGYGALLFHLIEEIMEKGKSDGSIRSDLDTNKAVYSLFLIISGFFNRLSEVGPGYSRRFGIEAEEIAGFTLDLVGDMLRGG